MFLGGIIATAVAKIIRRSSDGSLGNSVKVSKVEAMKTILSVSACSREAWGAEGVAMFLIAGGWFESDMVSRGSGRIERFYDSRYAVNFCASTAPSGSPPFN